MWLGLCLTLTFIKRCGSPSISHPRRPLWLSMMPLPIVRPDAVWSPILFRLRNQFCLILNLRLPTSNPHQPHRLLTQMSPVKLQMARSLFGNGSHLTLVFDRRSALSRLLFFGPPPLSTLLLKRCIDGFWLLMFFLCETIYWRTTPIP